MALPQLDPWRAPRGAAVASEEERPEERPEPAPGAAPQRPADELPRRLDAGEGPEPELPAGDERCVSADAP